MTARGKSSIGDMIRLRRHEARTSREVKKEPATHRPCAGLVVTLPMVFFGAGTWSVQAGAFNSIGSAGGVYGSWTVPQSACSYLIGPSSATQALIAN